MTKEELLPLWQADAENLCSGIRLYDEGEMMAAVQKAREWLRTKDRDIQSDIGVITTILRNLQEVHENFWGVSQHWWWVKACLIIVDDTRWHPWFDCVWYQYQHSRGLRKMDTLWGSASAGKSEAMACLAITNTVIWCGLSHCYLTAPYMKHGADKVWRYVTRRWEKWMRTKPTWLENLWITLESSTDHVSAYNQQTGETSQISLVTLQDSSSIQGKKRIVDPFDLDQEDDERTDVNDKRKGVMLLLSDEFAENRNLALEEAEANYMSNANYYGLVACNPKPDKVQEPTMISFSEPVNIDRRLLKEEYDMSWETCRGRLLRFCIYNTPNRFSEKRAFRFLISKEQAEAQAKRGDYQARSQVRAWGFEEGNVGAKFSSQDATRSDVRGPVQWKDNKPVRTMFVDLAFGGRDACTYCWMQHGISWEGKDELEVGGQEEIIVKPRWKPTDEEWDEFIRMHANPEEIRKLRRENLEFLNPNYHVAYGILREKERLGIPSGNVSFDSSQRPEAYRIIGSALGKVIWHYEGTKRVIDEEIGFPYYPPEINPSDGDPVKWSDRVTQVITVLWEFCEALIAEGKIKNLSKAERGWKELLARPRDSRGSGTGLKKDVRGKNQLPKSPTYGETLCSNTYFAVRFCGALPNLLAETASVQVPEFNAGMYGFEGEESGLDVECFA